MAKAQAQKKKQSDFFVKVAKLSKGAKVAILLCAIAAIIVAFYMLYYSPWKAEVASLESEVETLNQTLSTEQANLNKHKAIEEFVPPVKVSYDYLSHLFTNTDEIDGLVNIISELGAQAGVNTNSSNYIFRTKTVLTPLFAEIQFTIDLEAPFLNFLKFLYNLSNYSRLINITSVSMGTPNIVDSRQVLLKIRCEGSAYRKLTPDEVKLAPPAK
ncbi:MAG: type 4a pilus biogenesis protein PilO [Deltaproteobacteria bacterium]|jgi:Tfp pilus assembly protein PilO|nr:type 4a pilus biogenesis protein PilO [Deltaproteobacteria bacterium]